MYFMLKFHLGIRFYLIIAEKLYLNLFSDLWKISGRLGA